MALRNTLVSGLLLATFVGIAAGCSDETAPRAPGFWDAQQGRVYARVTTNDENQAAQTAANLQHLLSAMGPAAEDATDLGTFRTTGPTPTPTPAATPAPIASATPTPSAAAPIAPAPVDPPAPVLASPTAPTAPSGIDLVSLAEIGTKCRLRQVTTRANESNLTNVQAWYDDADTTSCPVTYTMTETHSVDGYVPPVREGEGQVRSAGANVGIENETTDWTINYQAKTNTDVYSQGVIRSFTLNHHSESYVRHWKPTSPDTVSASQLTKVMTGSMVLSNGITVPFSVHHSRDLTATSIDDSGATYSGRDLMELELDMPHGASIITYDTPYDGKTRSPVTLVYVNGQLQK